MVEKLAKTEEDRRQAEAGELPVSASRAAACNWKPC